MPSPLERCAGYQGVRADPQDRTLQTNLCENELRIKVANMDGQNSNSTPEQRAAAVLEVIAASAVTRSASGRYRRSEPIAPGIRYWASSQPRLRRDLLGIQFYGGEWLARAALLRDPLERAGFIKRTPQASQLTFAKLVPFGPADRLDFTALRATKDEVDAILKAAPIAGEPGAFRRFMLTSPMAEIDLPLPSREGHWRSESF